MTVKFEDIKVDAAQVADVVSSTQLRDDSAVFFARQLEYIKAQTYDVKRANLSAFQRFPINTSTPEGANTITYRQYDTVGMAKIIDNAANDLPTADVTAKEFTANIRSIGNAYTYSTQEIRNAQYAGVPLTTKKVVATQRAQMELINKIAFFGDTANGLQGLKTNANIPELTIANDGTGSSKTFATKTPSQIVRDVNNLINLVLSQSKGVHRANEVWMPIEQYAYIATTQNSAASDTTILQFLKQVNPNVEFYALPELDQFGASSADRMYALENSMDNWQLEIPMMFKQEMPQQDGLLVKVPAESRCGGVIVEYPLAFAFADGI